MNTRGVAPDLTTGPILVRSAVWNLLGQLIPVVVAVVTVPHLLRGLGLERFGILTLAWTVVGYFTLFDLGLGWALTRLVSERLAAGRVADVPAVVWTSLILLLGLGAIGAVAVALLGPSIVRSVLHVPASLVPETLQGLQLLALSIPIVIGNAALTGVLAAQQRFALINAVRVPLAALSYLGPLLVLHYSDSLVPVLAVLVASRLAGWIVSWWLCVRSLPGLGHRVRFESSLIRELLGYGGWVTVTNIVGPVMVYLDRFLVGSMLTLAAVSYYATPYDLASRLWLLSTPAVAVLFPAFAASFEIDRARTTRLFVHGVRYAFCVLFPGVLLIAALAPEGLQAWLGSEFATHGVRVLRILAVGVFINGVAQMALALVQSAGRPAWSARLHLIELPLYLATAWWLIRTYGIEGAAIAWTARAGIDAIALGLKSCALLGVRAARMRVAALAMVAAIGTVIVACLLPAYSPVKMVFLAVALATHLLLAWRLVIVPGREALALARGPVQAAP